MPYTAVLPSPLGPLALCCDDTGLTALRFAAPDTPPCPPEHPLLREAARWLDVYWSGRNPGALPPLHLSGTPFQQEIWALLLALPYGHTCTYGALAAQLAARRGLARMSAQAVGGAVGRNPVAILVPCHRVLGADGALTGYAYGLERKRFLLELEGKE